MLLQFFRYEESTMACRGVFFALSSSQGERLLAFDSDKERLAYIQDVIEAAWDQAHLLQTDKAWDAIHRCLGDGSLAIARSESTLGKLVLGGRQLYSDTQSYIINLIDCSELPAISAALEAVTEEWLKARYEQLRSTDYPPASISEEGWKYTWDWFSGIPDFIARASQEGRSVIFTVNQ